MSSREESSSLILCLCTSDLVIFEGLKTNQTIVSGLETFCIGFHFLCFLIKLSVGCVRRASEEGVFNSELEGNFIYDKHFV